MDSAEGKAALLRIERGQATEEELAAVAVTLLSLVARHAKSQEEDSEDRSAACRHRQRRTWIYQAPHSWR